MKKIALALALVFLPVAVHPLPTIPSGLSFPQKPAVSERPEARLEQQKSKWAPNGMKVLIIHGQRRWAVQGGLPQVEKQKFVPILKEGV